MEYDSRTERLPHDQQVCALVQDLLPLYIEDEVSGQSRAMIVAHLNECAHCAGFLRGARSARMQFERERTRESERTLENNPTSPKPSSVISFLTGTGGIAASAVMLVALVLYAFSRPLWSFLIGIGMGAAIHGIFLLACIGVTAILSLRLLRPRAASGLDNIVLVGLILGITSILVPFADPMYRIVGVVVITIAGTHVWLERNNTLQRWMGRKGRYLGVLLVLTPLVMVWLLVVTEGNVVAASFGTIPDSSFSEVSPLATPTPVFSLAYPAPVMGLPAPTPTITPAPTPTVAAQP